MGRFHGCRQVKLNVQQIDVLEHRVGRDSAKEAEQQALEVEGNCFAQDALDSPDGLSVQDNSFITEQDEAELLELVRGIEDSDCDNQPPPAKRSHSSVASSSSSSSESDEVIDEHETGTCDEEKEDEESDSNLETTVNLNFGTGPRTTTTTRTVVICLRNGHYSRCEYQDPDSSSEDDDVVN
jgi:U3 small nucleolar RNA-associated protein 14